MVTVDAGTQNRSMHMQIFRTRLKTTRLWAALAC